MADSAVVITAGTGTNIDTRTEASNGNHRQVIVVGDPSTNAGVAPVDATAGLKVDLGADNDVTVTSGSITANAGTNLNTSTLALESGGNLAAIAASLSVLDDWDETNRAAVNIIAGQVGVQGASGTVTALTQRVVLATDVALPAGTNNIGDVDVLTIPGIVGTVADDATTPGNPVMTGGKAVETDGTDPTSVSAEDDVAIFRTDRNRRQLVNTFHPNLWRVNENHSSAQTNNQLKAAPGSGLSLYITDIIISNGATAGSVQLVEDEGGTPATIAGPYYFSITGGMNPPLQTPIRLTADKSLGFTSTGVTTHTITIIGFTAP